MSRVCLLAALMGFDLAVLGQGQFVLNNRVPPDNNARFVLCTDPPGTSSLEGSAFHVQVFAALEGTPPNEFTNTVLATTDFRTGNAAGYVQPITVTVEGAFEEPVSVYLRVFNGDSWETATARYEGGFAALVSVAPGPPGNTWFGTESIVVCSPDAPPGHVGESDRLDQWNWRGSMSNHLNGIAFGDGSYVAVGDHGERGGIAVSKEGGEWVTASYPGTNRLAKVTFGDGRFVAVGDRGTIMVSSDGREWIQVDSTVTNDLASICHGPGLFVASGKGGTILASADAKIWTPQRRAEMEDFVASAYGEGVYYLAHRWGTLMSVDGLHWDADGAFWIGIESMTFGNSRFLAVGRGASAIIPNDNSEWYPLCPEWCDLNPRAVCFGAGKFVAVSADRGFIGSSLDGIAWKWNRASTDEPLNDIVYGTAGFVAVGDHGALFRSPDGETWTRDAAGNPGVFLDAAYGSGSFVLVGAASQTETRDLTGRKILYSPTGASWKEAATPTNLPLSDLQPLRAVGFGNGTFVGVPEPGPGVTVVSTNGSEWFAGGQVPGGSAVAWGAGQFVSVGNTFVLDDWGVWVSANGLNWRPIETPPADAQIRGIGFGEGVFVAVGEKALWLTSTNGQRWHRTVVANTNTKAAWNRVAYGNGKFVAVGDYGIVGFGSYFFRASSKTIHSLYSIAYGDQVFVAVGEAGTIITSPDGETWTVRDSGTKEDLYAVAFGNGTFLVAGARGTILQSAPPRGDVVFKRVQKHPSGLLLDIRCAPNRTFRVDVSTNLVDWIDAATITATAEKMIFFDHSWSNSPRKFYRAVMP